MKGLFHAGKFLALDMASSLIYLLIFWGAEKALHSPAKAVLVAVPVGVAFGIGQIGWELAHAKRPDAMQWLSLFLVVATGAATFLTKDPRFILFKPSIIYCVVGVVMLKPGWMNRYLPEPAVHIVPDIGVIFGYVWAGLMFFSAALNLFVAMKGDIGLSVKFLAIYPLASKLSLFAIQYATMRYIGRRRYLAMKGDIGLSVKFLAIYPLASKLSLFAIQYATMRYIGRRRYLAMTPEAQSAFEAATA